MLNQPLLNTPTLPGLTWRPLTPADLPAIAALAQTCLAVDGGLPLAGDESFIRARHWQPEPHATLGAWTEDGRLAAWATARDEEKAGAAQVALAGQVHPAYRQRGLGSFLLSWSVDQAQRLLEGRPATLRVATEGLTLEAERLYTRFGFAQTFAEAVMRRATDAPIPDAPLPQGVTLVEWTPERAEAFYTAYAASFADRPGTPGWTAAEWIAWATDDEDFRPDLSLLALSGATPVGFVIGSNGWLVQMGVRPEWRARGLGGALIAEVFRRFQRDGQPHILLDVNVNNPGAAQVYTRLGFKTIGRRARYERKELSP